MYWSSWRGIARATGVLAGFALAACSSDNTVSSTVSEAGGPIDVSAIPAAAPENVLTARVTFSAPAADSVRVSIQTTGGPVQSTPFRAPRAGSDTITVLGLHPTTVYRYQVEAVTNGVSRASSMGTFTTARLPAALANVQLQRISGNQSRYAATATGSYAIIFDTTGTIVWYHDFTSSGVTASNVVMQPNGDITTFLGTSSGWQPVDGQFVELTPAGKEVRTYSAPPGHYLDLHDLLLTGSGATAAAHFFTYTDSTENLSAIGSQPSILTAGHQVMREDASDAIQFTWDAWSHIAFDEWIGDTTAKAARMATDFDHPNALTFDGNGNYVVSWRNLDQIMGIDANSGAVLWRLGGLKGEYTFVNDPLNGFSKQHSVKVLPNGDILLFDNGPDHVPPESRAVEYRLDPAAKTATMVWQYRHSPALFAPLVGWVQRLANGNTWVAFSYFGRVVEVDPNDKVVWEGQMVVNGAATLEYRIVPLASLYSYVKP